MTESNMLGSPEFFALFIRASQEEIRIPLPDVKTATRMRFRLHNYRKAYRKLIRDPNASMQDKANAEILNQVEFAIIPGEEQVFLVAKPRDAEFREALAKAGVTAETVTSPATTAPEPERPRMEQAVEDYLKSGS